MTDIPSQGPDQSEETSSSDPPSAGDAQQETGLAQHSETQFSFPPPTVCQLTAIQSEDDFTDGIPSQFQFVDYYDLLDIPRDASHDTVEQAATTLLSKHHPDASQYDAPIATDLFMICTEARDILTHPSQREAYDELGHESYIAQSNEIGAFVTGTTSHSDDSETNPTSTESDPVQADASYSRPESEQRHLSETGRAYLSNRPIVGFPAATDRPLNTDTASQSDSPEASDSNARPTYFSVLDILPGDSGTSVRYLDKAWRKLWRLRLIITISLSTAVVGVVSLADQLNLAPAGIAMSPSLTLAGISIAGLLVLSTVYFNFVYELSMDRGRFISDTSQPYLSRHTASTHIKRGLTTGTVTILLSLSAASNGVSGWEYASRSLTEQIPSIAAGTAPSLQDSVWAPAAGDPHRYPPLVDSALSLVFVFCISATLYYLVSGLSISAWVSRYLDGSRTHPTIVEGFVVACLSSIGLGFMLPQIPIVSTIQLTPVQEVIPNWGQLLLGFHTGSVTQTTAIGCGFTLMILGCILYTIRLRLPLDSLSTSSSE